MIEEKRKFDLKKHSFLICVVCMFALFFLQTFFKPIMYVIYPLLLVAVLLDNLENGFSYLIIASNFRAMHGLTNSLLFFACVLAFIVKLLIDIIKNKRLVFNKRILILSGILFIYLLLPFGAYNKNYGLKFMYLFCILIALFVALSRPETFRMDKNIRWFAISLVVASLFSSLYFIFPQFQFKPFAYIGNGLYRFHAFFEQCNMLSMTCEITLGLIAYLIVGNKSKWYDFVLFGIVALIGVFTLSKTFLILLVILCIVLMVKICTYGKKPIAIMSSILLVGVVLLFTVLKEFTFGVFDRFFLDNAKSFVDIMNSITSCRYNIWLAYCSYLVHNPVKLLFGSGLGAKTLPGMLSTHNLYLALIYQLGVAGTILFVWTIVEIIKLFMKTKKFKISRAAIIPLVTIGLIFCVEDMIFYILLK